MISSTTGWPFATNILAAIDLAKLVNDLSVAVTCAATVLLIAIVVTTILVRDRHSAYKKPLFTLIIVISAITTLVISSVVLIMNFNSPTKGPVSWASDYQIWVCGNQLNVRGPQGLLSNRVGTTTLFEQNNDSRIHFEGTPLNLPRDASFGTFLGAIGGRITDASLVIPLNENGAFTGNPESPEQVQPYLATNRDGTYVSLANGQTCGGVKSQIQSFVFHFNTNTNTYTQAKLEHPSSYELSHASQAPPGDCVIVDFAPLEDQTTHLCASYGVLDKDRCIYFGVPANKTATCTAQEVR